MSNEDVRSTIAAVARVDGFRRDTPLLLRSLDRLEQLQRELRSQTTERGKDHNV